MMWDALIPLLLCKPDQEERVKFDDERQVFHVK